MLKSYKYRLYPNKEQINFIEANIGCCRLVYNLALQTKIEAYKQLKINLSSFDLINQLTDLKKDYEWLRKVDSQALIASIRKIDISYKNFYNGNCFPKYKNKKGKQSYQCQSGVRRIDWERSILIMPKIEIPIILSRKFKGQIKTVTISRVSSGKYFASILVDNAEILPNKSKINTSSTVGIDLGLKHFAVTSESGKIDNPRYLRSNEKRLKVLQRRASRKKKGSKSKQKANKKVAIQHEKITNQRKDFLHKVSTNLINNHDTLVFETLRISNMIKNHNLAKSISDVGWGMFVEFCKYKANWLGKNIIQIGQYEPSTKLCGNCKAVTDNLRLSDREWFCPNCNTLHDRDINAAINIKQMGLKQHVLSLKNNSRKGIPGESVESLSIDKAMKQKVRNNISTV